MKKYLIQSAAISLCVCLVGCQNPWKTTNHRQASAKQTIDMNLSATNTSWKIVKQSNDPNTVMMMTMMPNDQNPSNWKEGIRTTTTLYTNKPGITAEKFVQNEVSRAQKYCSQVNASVLSQTSQATIYQLNIASCSGNFPDQMIIGKAFNGTDGVYAARYSAKTGQVSDSEVDAMTEVIKSSRLVSNI